MYVYIHTYIHICMCVCVYIYIYVWKAVLTFAHLPGTVTTHPSKAEIPYSIIQLGFVFNLWLRGVMIT